jgi:hypothetical protein
MTGRALLNSKAAEHLTEILGYLGSDNENERANAGRLANDFIKQPGLCWADVIVIAQPPAAEWQWMAKFCAERRTELNDTERNFVGNIRSLRRQPSDRQLEWLESIYARLQQSEDAA